MYDGLCTMDCACSSILLQTAHPRLAPRKGPWRILGVTWTEWGWAGLPRDPLLAEALPLLWLHPLQLLWAGWACFDAKPKE